MVRRKSKAKMTGRWKLNTGRRVVSKVVGSWVVWLVGSSSLGEELVSSVNKIINKVTRIGIMY